MFSDELAFAERCLRREPEALALLERDYVQKTEAALGSLGLSAADRDDVRQKLWFRLVLDDPPRLAEYRGNGALVGFVRAVAVRIALDERRRGRRAIASEAELEALADASDGPERSFTKRVSRTQFQRAFATALAALGTKERTLLRQAYVDGLSNEAIAHLHGTHRATVFRWMVEARRRLAKELHETLAAELHLSAAEVPSFAAFIRSELSLSLPRVLA